MKKANRPVPTLIEEIAMEQTDYIEELEEAAYDLKEATKRLLHETDQGTQLCAREIVSAAEQAIAQLKRVMKQKPSPA